LSTVNRVEGGTVITTRAVASLLRKAWLLAAILAVIAGLLGMHVLTSGHASHRAAAGHTAVAHSAGHAGHMADASTTDMQGLTSAICGDSCPGAQESGAPCVPSAPSGPVTVAPPEAAQAVPLPGAAVNAGSGYSYVPPSPTPCELSISRT